MKYMKSAMAVVLAMTLLLAGCGSGGDSPSGGGEAPAPDVSQLGDDMKAAVALEDELMEIEGDVLSNLYEYDAESIAGYKVYASSTMSTPEEIAVFVAADEESVAYIEEMLDYRLQTLRFNYESYAPLEMPKIENAKVLKKGLYLALVVCSDPAPAEEVFDKAFQS